MIGDSVFSLEILPFFLAAVALIGLGLWSWRSRRLDAVRYLSLTLFLCAIWAFSEAFSKLTGGISAKIFWMQVSFSAMVIAPVTWLAMAILLTGQMRKLVRRYFNLFFFIPVISILILWTGEIGVPGYHGELMMTNLRLVHVSVGLLGAVKISPTVAATPLKLVLAYSPGPWFAIQMIYSVGLIFISLFLLFRAVLQTIIELRRGSRPAASAEMIHPSGQEPVSPTHRDYQGTPDPEEMHSLAEDGSELTAIWHWLNIPGAHPTWGYVQTLLLLIIGVMIPLVNLMIELGYQIDLLLREAQAGQTSIALGQLLLQQRITLYYRTFTPVLLIISALPIAWMLFSNRSLFAEQASIIPVARSSVIESMHDGVLVLDRRNRIVDFNPAAQTLCNLQIGAESDAPPYPPVHLRRGMEVSEALIEFPDLLAALGSPSLEELDSTSSSVAAGVVAGDDTLLSPWSSQLDDSFDNTVRLTRRTRMPSKPQEPARFLDLRVSAIFEKNGAVSGRLVVLRDVTERNRAEDALRRLKEFNEAIVQGMAEGIMVEDSANIITFVNPAGAAMLGYSSEELVGKPALSLVAADYVELIAQANQRRVHGQADRYELNLIRKDGNTITVLVAGMPLFETETRGLSGTIAVYTDITERKLAELALISSEKRHRRLVEQLAILNRIGLAVFAPNETVPGSTSPRDINNVIHILYQQCQQIGEMDCFYVALFDEETGMLRFPVFYNRDEQGQMEVTSYADSHIDDYTGLTSYVIRSFQTLYIADITDSSLLPVFQGQRIQPMITSSRMERSFLAVPLILGAETSMLDALVPPSSSLHNDHKSDMDVPVNLLLSEPLKPKVVGIISMQSFQPGAYSEEQVKLLETVALQAAVALENSRLYEQVQHELEQRSQAEEALRQANANLQEHVEEIESLQANLQASLKRLAEQAIRDPLTDLFNRRYLHETLERELARASRLGQPISLVMVDIDHFKPLNDAFLHDAGDRVLQALSELLRTHCRQEDIACRYGGEEFVVVMPGAPLEVAYQRAERWRQAFSELEFQVSDFALLTMESSQSEKILRGQTPGTFRATISLGVSVFPEHGVSGDVLLRAADRAMYAAKVAGRNRTHIFSP
jgi:diguanylate cyclase (GGDEF)-like protein/PAS domain S-box-containing protein